jgi:hypothetical protein
MVKRKKSLLKSGNSSMGNGMGVPMDTVNQHPHPPDYPRKNKTVKRPNLGGGYGSVETAEDWKGDRVLHKDGDGGGFSGTVATTADSGYYTPTYGRARTTKKRRKTNAADDTSVTVGIGRGTQAPFIKALDALTLHLLKRTIDPAYEPVTVSETDAEPSETAVLEQNNTSKEVEESEETKKDAGSIIKNYAFDGRGFDELARGGLKDKGANDGQHLVDTELDYDNEDEEEERPDFTDDEVYTLLNKFIDSTL